MNERLFVFGQESTGLELNAQWRGEWLGVQHWQVFGIDLARHDYSGYRDGTETNLATGAVTLIAAPDFENPTDTDRNNTYIVRIRAVDAAGKPTPVSPLTPSTPDEVRRHAAAELRRAMRQEMEQRHAAIR